MGNRFIKEVQVPSLEAAFKDFYIIPAEHFAASGKDVKYDEFDMVYMHKKQTKIVLNSRTGCAGRIHPHAIRTLEKLLTGAGYKYRIRYIKDTEDGVHSGWYVDVCNPVYPDVQSSMCASTYVCNLVVRLNDTVEGLYR